mgnify:CR=1 FL=1
MIKLSYRPEIDTLRAIAVLAVIIYHAKINAFDNLIFPGGFLPSLNSIKGHCKQSGLELTGYNSYGSHYSNTLKEWRKNFTKSWDQISKQGFDLSFKKIWDFYFSYCEAGFKSKNINLIQIYMSNK